MLIYEEVAATSADNTHGLEQVLLLFNPEELKHQRLLKVLAVNH